MCADSSPVRTPTTGEETQSVQDLTSGTAYCMHVSYCELTCLLNMRNRIENHTYVVKYSTPLPLLAIMHAISLVSVL